MKTGVYIGRFQPIHEGHLYTIKQALNNNDRLIILIGSYNRLPTIKNPFDISTRQELITRAIMEYFGEKISKGWTDKPYPENSVMYRIKFGKIRDYLYNDYKWLAEASTQATMLGASDDDSTTLYGCKKDESSYYLDMFPRWNFKRMPYINRMDSTIIRDELYENGSYPYGAGCMKVTCDFLNKWVGSEDFRNRKQEYEYYKQYKKDHSFGSRDLLSLSQKVVDDNDNGGDASDSISELRQYLSNNNPPSYEPIHNTTDCIVIRSGCVLLIKRKFPNDVWALVGGFLDSGESIKDGAIRELKEETRIKVPQEELKSSIVDYKVFDHPQRSLRGRVVTHCFLIDLGNGHLPSVKGDSDASGAVWVPISDALQMENVLFEDHYDILVNMINKY